MRGRILNSVEREPPIQEPGSAVLVDQRPVHEILDDPGLEICRENHSLPYVRGERPVGCIPEGSNAESSARTDKEVRIIGIPGICIEERSPAQG